MSVFMFSSTRGQVIIDFFTVQIIGLNRSRIHTTVLFGVHEGAITFAHIFQKFRLRTVFICAQKYISFAHSFTVTFAHMFVRLFLGQLLVFY